MGQDLHHTPGAAPPKVARRPPPTGRRVTIAVAAVALIWCAMGGVLLVTELRRAAHQFTLNMDLHQALFRDDHLKAESLLKQGANPNSADTYPALVSALIGGDQKMVRLLLRYGASPSKALHAAPTEDEAAALVRLGADVNARSRFAMTPLMVHGGNGNVAVVRFLVAHGADPLLRDDSGRTALDWAEREQHRIPPAGMEAYAASRAPDYERVRALLCVAAAATDPDAH